MGRHGGGVHHGGGDGDKGPESIHDKGVCSESGGVVVARSSNERQLDLQAKIIVERLSQHREPLQTRPSMTVFPGAAGPKQTGAREAFEVSAERSKRHLRRTLRCGRGRLSDGRSVLQ